MSSILGAGGSPVITPRDEVLWELALHGGKLKKSDLRRCTRLKISELEPILEEQAREGRIRISGEAISLIY